jgi:hypothetical protein
MEVNCFISLGELVDKLSILKVKYENIEDPQKLDFIKKEMDLLESELQKLDLTGVDGYLNKLIKVNRSLWDIEDQIRLKEKEEEFGAEFIEIARSVYKTNDLRFNIKNEVNDRYGSSIREMKSYEDYVK